MVAKGIARKLGGDLLCIKAETEGPNHGSEFEIKLPVMAGETISRPPSPFGSPMPRQAVPAINTAQDGRRTPPWPPEPTSPQRLARLQDPLSCAELLSSPPSPRSQPRPQLAIPQPQRPIAVSSPPSSSSENAVKPNPRPRMRKPASNPEIDRDLASKYPLNFLVAEDNASNRKLLVGMLQKFGYKTVHQAHNGAEAVRQMSIHRPLHEQVDVVLMDLWMPLMDGYEATEKILGMNGLHGYAKGGPTVLAVTADVTDHALERAAAVGMKGYMTKPYKMLDLQKLITEYCAGSQAESDPVPTTVEG